MKLLAVETATEACSVALWLDGQVRETSNQEAVSKLPVKGLIVLDHVDQRTMNFLRMMVLPFSTTMR